MSAQCTACGAVPRPRRRGDAPLRPNVWLRNHLARHCKIPREDFYECEKDDYIYYHDDVHNDDCEGRANDDLNTRFAGSDRPTISPTEELTTSALNVQAQPTSQSTLDIEPQPQKRTAAEMSGEPLRIAVEKFCMEFVTSRNGRDRLLQLVQTVTQNVSEALDLPTSWTTWEAQSRKRRIYRDELGGADCDVIEQISPCTRIKPDIIRVKDKQYNFYHLRVELAVQRLLERHPLLNHTAVEPMSFSDMRDGEAWRTSPEETIRILLYIDGTSLNAVQNLSVTPIILALANHPVQTRSSISGKELLGFVPGEADTDQKRLLLHACLEKVATEIDLIPSTELFLIIGDTLAQNANASLKSGRTQYPCRLCTAGRDSMHVLQPFPPRTAPADLQHLYSHHPDVLTQNALVKRFGNETYYKLPMDLLHTVYGGIFKYVSIFQLDDLSAHHRKTSS